MSKPFGRIEVSTRTARRDQQIEHLHSENSRLRAALAVREKTIRKLRAEIEQTMKEKTHDRT
ncbi:MAG: hypothetical protein ACLP19_18215 [Xanthobacteraceae bacterium]